MGLMDRLRGRGRAGRGRPRSAVRADLEHLARWASGRVGVEAFAEPQTLVTEFTVVLVDRDGEWTRRRVDGRAGARRLGKELRIPVYDVQIVGYPRRMRDHEARRRVLRERERRRDLEA
jgi:hypothetical protein